MWEQKLQVGVTLLITRHCEYDFVSASCGGMDQTWLVKKAQGVAGAADMGCPKSFCTSVESTGPSPCQHGRLEPGGTHAFQLQQYIRLIWLPF